MTSAGKLRVLLITNLGPLPTHPERGALVRRQFAEVSPRLHPSSRIVVVGKSGSGGLFASKRAVRAALSEVQPDVIHIYYGLSGVALPKVKLPIVLSLCGSDILRWSRRRDLRGLFERKVSIMTARRSAVVIVQSGIMLAALPTDIWPRTQVEPTGVASNFHPRSRSACRALLGWPLDVKTVLFPADPCRSEKRFDLARGAVARAERMLGDAISLRTLGAVPPDDVPLHMSAADCVLITSEWEAGPVVLQEALACHTPVISVPVGYALDHPSSQSLTVVQPDTSALAKAIKSLLSSAGPVEFRAVPKLQRRGSDYSAMLLKAYEKAYRSTVLGPHR